MHVSAGIQSGNWPQTGVSASQGTSASSAGGGLPSGRDSLLPGSSGVSQPQTGSAVLGKTGKQPARNAAHKNKLSLERQVLPTKISYSWKHR